MIEYSIDKVSSGLRLDAYLAGEGHGLSRSFIQKLIEGGKVRVNDHPAKPGYRLKLNDKVTVEVPPPKKFELKPENIPLDVVYEDDDVMVVYKPRGMVTHPAAGNYTGTLVHALLYHARNLSGVGGVLRPGIVHRLDKDTSGLLLVAKSDLAHRSLSKQIKDRTVKREYVALVHGVIEPDDGYVQAPIGRHPVDRKKMAVISDPDLKSREALTFFKVLKRFDGYTLVQLKLKTGRTHQIRVHMSYIKHPVVGDKTYGGKTEVEGTKVTTLLHARTVGFVHPRTGEPLEFSHDMPEDMKEIIDLLSKK
ncbi:MAG TPA: RluA family pseudouridine synthase [Candidatus Omnitrophota bacterium]|nr:RluA family pseudouridine synthase [Candidatus Omnitrophota bacterium]